MQIFAFPNRKLLKIHGPDAHDFLQRLISQDLDLLQTQDAIYSCLFTAQGRYEFDFIMFKQNDAYMIDAARAEALKAKLDFYKMRAELSIDLIEDSQVFTSLEDGQFLDPRHTALGHRLYQAPADAIISDLSKWHKIRIQSGVFDGESDASIGKSNASELHIDRLNGINWDKGCYLGQELTARMRYRGGGKKHLYIVEAPPELPKSGEALGHGIMYSQQDNIGLALLRDNEINELPYKITEIK